MAKLFSDLSKQEQEDIKQTLRKQRQADEIEKLMCEELDKCKD